MEFSFYIARRYLISKKSNNAINIISWISIIAIAVTTAALVIILSAVNGMTEAIATLYNTVEPDVKITNQAGRYFVIDEAMLRRIKSVAGVEAVSKTLSDQVLIKNLDKQALVSIKGVDRQFDKITRIDSAISEGSYNLYQPGRRSIILGRGVANQLHVNMNVFVNEMAVYSPVRGKTSSLNLEDNLRQVYCTPGGIFLLNNELDERFAFVSLETASELLDRPGQVSALEIACQPGSADEVIDQLKQLLGDEFTIKNRYQLNDMLFKSLETEKLATFIILAFILVIATFNIIGAITMLIFEKKNDIKTLYSMGADLSKIRNIFMNEAFLISGIGVISGLLLGLLVCWMQIQFHLVSFGDEYILPYYPIQLQFKDFAWIFCLIMFISFLSALYPVRVFTKTDLVH